jgi:hypothetical protein
VTLATTCIRKTVHGWMRRVAAIRHIRHRLPGRILQRDRSLRGE